MLKRTLISLVLFAALLFAGSANDAFAQESAEDGGRRHFVHSNYSAGVGEGTLAMGGRIFIPGSIPLPSYDIWYRRGFHEMLDLEVHASTFGILSWIDVGVRSKLFGDEAFSLGLRADLTTMLIFISFDDESASAFAFGVTPGLIASFGTKTFQFSVGVDAPIFFAGGGVFSSDSSSSSSSGTGTGIAALIRPTLAAEFPVSDGTNMFIDLGVLIPVDAPDFYLPVLGIGAAW